MLGVNGKLLDFIYPVGSYYETSDTSFNPNTVWGGTWLEDTKGRVTVALDSEDTDFDTLGETGGSKDLQEHSHTYNISTSGAGGGDGTRLVVWNGTGTTYNNASGAIANTGTGNSGNIQPYIVVKRWHRTA